MARLIIGLGNPGKQYDNTYHNAGFLALDFFITQGKEKKKYSDTSWKTPSKKHFAYAKSGAHGLIFVKPKTFMNESGAAVREAVEYFGIPPSDILIVHDDSDLAIGVYKITKGQRSAGHRGVGSAIQAMGTGDFYRLKIGIREERPVREKAEKFVLREISAQNRRLFYSVFSDAKDNVIENVTVPFASVTRDVRGRSTLVNSG